ncbi:MAG: S26 family signal peptidase, partial [Minisyncoccia bacterium]
KNSQGIPYTFSGNKYKMLALYENDYKGIIPPNTYLLLGDQVNGSVDATVFGLVDKSDIIGKAILLKK